MRAELYVYFTWKTFLHRGKHRIGVKTMQHDTQHLVEDARLYAYSGALRTREKGIRLLLIQDLYSERKSRHYAPFHKPCGQRLAKHGLFAVDKSAEHDGMLRNSSVSATGAGRRGDAWDTAFV